jgi:hypothetical protein
MINKAMRAAVLAASGQIERHRCHLFDGPTGEVLAHAA